MSFLWGNTANQPTEPKKFANINNDQINSNQQAIPVKVLHGRNFVAGDYITPAYNPKAVAVKSQTGKGQTSVTGYKYYADFALVFCMGGRHPVDAIFKVIVDSDIRWTGNVTRTVGVDKVVITVQDLGVIHLYWGSETQAIDSVLLSPRGVASGGIDPTDSTTWPAASATGGQTTYSGFPSGNANPYSGHYDTHPAYRGQCYGVFVGWKLGRDRTSVPNIQLELMRGAPWISGGDVSSNDTGVNPIAVLFDWLTDTRFGIGLPESSLNTSTFTGTYNDIEALAGRISPVITQQSDFRQVIAQLMEYYDGWIRRNGQLIEVGFWKHGTGIVPVVTALTDDDLLAEPALEPQGWGPTFNEITVTYKDRAHYFNDYVQVHRDPNNFRITGAPRPETLNRPWITDAAVAKQYAKETGAALALPFTRGTLTVRREWLTNNAVLVGMVIQYNSGFYGLSFYLRVLEIEYPADNAAQAIMTVEWERSKWPSIYIPPPFVGPGGFVLGPRSIWQSRITEIPYILQDHRFETQLIALAVRGNVEVQGYRTWISLDSGSTYQVMPDASSTSAFSAFGRLTTSLTDTDTTVYFSLYGIDLDSVVSQTAAQQSDDNLMLFVESEVLSVGTVTSLGSGAYSANIIRGRYGTFAVAHTQPLDLYFVFRANLKLIDNAGFIPGSTILVKLQPFTADTDYDLTAVTPITYVIVGQGNIPDPSIIPNSSEFNTSTLAVIIVYGGSGTVPHYTIDGTTVGLDSPEWPFLVGPPKQYTNLILTGSTTLKARHFHVDGRSSSEGTFQYTKITGTPSGGQCGIPAWTYSGKIGQSGGNLTLYPTTAGATTYYSKNSAGFVTYSSPIAVACGTGGDTVEFYGSASGLGDSNHRYIDFSRQINYGGGSIRHQPQ